jgi:hypothetical protein
MHLARWAMGNQHQWLRRRIGMEACWYSEARALIQVSVTTQSGHELGESIKTQTPITIMPQNRWPCLRDPDWESEDVSEKRDTGPQPCAS